jgi:hypothetical protein
MAYVRKSKPRKEKVKSNHNRMCSCGSTRFTMVRITEKRKERICKRCGKRN